MTRDELRAWLAQERFNQRALSRGEWELREWRWLWRRVLLGIAAPRLLDLPSMREPMVVGRPRAEGVTPPS